MTLTFFGATLAPDEKGVHRGRVGLLDVRVEQKEHVDANGVMPFFVAFAEGRFARLCSMAYAKPEVALQNLEQVVVGCFGDLDRSLPRARA